MIFKDLLNCNSTVFTVKESGTKIEIDKVLIEPSQVTVKDGFMNANGFKIPLHKLNCSKGKLQDGTFLFLSHKAFIKYINEKLK